MYPISLTVRAKKDTRNRYFLVDSLRATLSRQMRRYFARWKANCRYDQEWWYGKIPRRNFLIRFRSSGLHYQAAYSSWLIIESNGVCAKGAGTGPGHAVARSNGVAWRRVSINYSHNYDRRSLSAVFALDGDRMHSEDTRVTYRIRSL